MPRQDRPPDAAGDASESGADADRPEPARPPQPLSEQEAAQILEGATPTHPDRFAVLNRRGGRPLSDDQAVQILQVARAGNHRPRDPAALPDLPVARRSDVPSAPVAVLDYRGRVRPRPPHHPLWRAGSPLAQVPVPIRVARVAVWLAVAVLMVLALLGRGH